MAIIRAQQRHAKCVTVTERCRLAEVVDDAIRISGVEQASDGATVIREYADATVTVDRHRAIQILVNLLTNARDALRDADRADRRIWVTTGRGENRIFVRVRDNGPGIPQSEITKVFAMGFTTKPEGHGFGLHASCNAAAEIGGALRLLPQRAEEPGAVFELTLPDGPSGEASPA
jgi:C4-dicarboxylate-specific signal transduction histidine kinase